MQLRSDIWVVLEMRVPFRVLFIEVPYYFGDLKRGPNLENYPYISDPHSQSIWGCSAE